MENCMGFKLKRKEFDDADDEVFADFCLSSPAYKIRRLDADSAPIVEENGARIPLKHEQPIPESAVSKEVIDQVNPLDIEELPFVPQNNEKAIVLFKPVEKPLFYSPNHLSIDPSLISSFKNQALFHAHQTSARPSEDEAERNGDNGEWNGCKAIVPWVPSQSGPILASQTDVSGSMESEDMEVAMMDIEEAGASNVSQEEANEYIKYSTTISEGLQHQWQQQQHCMVPQPPQNTTTPIVWYR